MGYGSFKYEGYQRRHALMICQFFDKKTCGAVKTKIVQNKELTEELNKQIIKNFEKRNIHSSFIDNIWGNDLADMQLIGKFNKGFRFLDLR